MLRKSLTCYQSDNPQGKHFVVPEQTARKLANTRPACPTCLHTCQVTQPGSLTGTRSISLRSRRVSSLLICYILPKAILEESQRGNSWSGFITHDFSSYSFRKIGVDMWGRDRITQQHPYMFESHDRLRKERGASTVFHKIPSHSGKRRNQLINLCHTDKFTQTPGPTLTGGMLTWRKHFISKSLSQESPP